MAKLNSQQKNSGLNIIGAMFRVSEEFLSTLVEFELLK